jgi:uncharacterized protein YxjI
VPSTGTWYVVADLDGYPGRVGLSARVLPGALPEIRQPDLRQIIREAAEPDPDMPLPDAAREHDVSISHATEDKDGIVRDLVQALQSHGVNVWYEEFELRVGDSLRRRIDQGLARSRFGLVVVSKAFFEKNWTQYELDGLVALEMAGRQRILPVWHQVTKDDVLSYSPSLADKVALSTGAFTVEEIATEIANVVGVTAPQSERENRI